MSGGPLVATLSRLSACHDEINLVVGTPSGDRWFGLEGALADDAVIDSWLAAVLDGPAAGHRDVAGSYLAAWLSGIVVAPVVAALFLERRTWPVRAANLAVHHHADGWFDKLAVCGPTLRLLADDAEAGHSAATVVDGVDALRRTLADEIAELADRIFAAVRARSPFGRRGMWGGLADQIAETLVFLDSTAGDPTAVAETDALLGALAASAAVPITRPRIEAVATSGGGAGTFVVKGTCCLFHKTIGRAADRESDEDFCTSCPLRDDGWRRSRWIARLTATTEAPEC